MAHVDDVIYRSFLTDSPYGNYYGVDLSAGGDVWRFHNNAIIQITVAKIPGDATRDYFSRAGAPPAADPRNHLNIFQGRGCPILSSDQVLA